MCRLPFSSDTRSSALPWNEPKGGRPVSEVWAKARVAKQRMMEESEKRKRIVRMVPPSCGAAGRLGEDGVTQVNRSTGRLAGWASNYSSEIGRVKANLCKWRMGGAA